MSSENLNHLDAEISLAHIENGAKSDKPDMDSLSQAYSRGQDESIDTQNQPQSSPADTGKNYNEFFAGKKEEQMEIQAFNDDEMKSIDLNADYSISRDKQSEFGYFPMDM